MRTVDPLALRAGRSRSLAGARSQLTSAVALMQLPTDGAFQIGETRLHARQGSVTIESHLQVGPQRIDQAERVAATCSVGGARRLEALLRLRQQVLVDDAIGVASGVDLGRRVTQLEGGRVLRRLERTSIGGESVLRRAHLFAV